ncbi:MAG: hypothetical protein AB3N16_15460 [Flavobacteriaceae bacterium]
MKKTFAIAFCLLGIVGINGQTSGQIATYTPGVGAFTDGLYNYAMGSISDKTEKSTHEDRTIEGSPYSSNQFASTTLYYGEEDMGVIYYRYNAYNEEVEIKEKNMAGIPIRGLQKDKKISIIMDNKKLSFKTFIDRGGNTINGYLLSLAEGNKYTLYRRINVEFTEGKKAPNSFVKAVPAKFSQFIEYYMYKEGAKRIDEIPLKNNKFLNLLDSESKEKVKVFLKENALNIKKESDLIEVFAFLNS